MRSISMRQMMISTVVCLTLFQLLSLPLAAREITLYRTVIGVYDTFQEAQRSKRGQQEIMEQGESFIVVDGWYQRFESALPEDAPRDPKSAWKHVYAVEVEETDVRNKGFTVERALPEQAKDRHSGYISQSRTLNTLIINATTAIDAANLAERSGESLDEILNLLTPSEAPLVAMLEIKQTTHPTVFANLHLGRLYFLQGKQESRQRLPHVKQRQLKEMTVQEENAYQSAIERLQAALENAPGKREWEDAEYYIAQARYHMVHHGHEVHQYYLAEQAQKTFINNHPQSRHIPEVKVQLQETKLELARRGEAKFEEVIQLGSAFLERPGNAAAKEVAHTHLLIAEAVMEGQRDYQQVKDLTQYVIEAYRRQPDTGAVIGTAYRLQGYAQYFSGDYEDSFNTWNRYITGGYKSPENNFFYRTAEKNAAAHFWRGYASMRLEDFASATADFQYVLQEYPKTEWAYYSTKAIETINEN